MPTPEDAPRGVLRGAVTGTSGVLLVVAVLVVGTAALLPTALEHQPSSRALPWWVLTAMFMVVEVSVLHVQVRREAQTVSLSEIPVVLGLFFADPVGLIVARVLGAFVVFVLHRKQASIKLVFNTALMGVNVVLAVAVFSAIEDRADVTSLTSWVALFTAVAVAGLVDVVATSLAIAAYEEHLSLRDLLRSCAAEPPRATAVATLGLVAVLALSVDVRAALPLAATSLIVMLSYRAYASLSDRHLSLERLYRFSQAVTSRPEVDEVLRSVLSEAKAMLRAETAAITFLSSEPSAVRVALNAEDRLVRTTVSNPAVPGSLESQVVQRVAGVLLPRGTKDPFARAWLEALDVREAVMVPLKGEAGVVGTLTVADRLGDVRTFVAADVKLLETVANHASVALQNSRLIGQLRHDALHDALTGLPNRVQLQRSLAEALVRLTEGTTPGVAVMIMDLDGFKDVNDTLGHQQGDALLVQVAVRLRQAVGSDAVVTRLGGDEFAVLLPDCPGVDAALRRARRLTAALEHPIDLEGLEVSVGGSVGVAWAPEHGTDVSSLLKRADLAMYAAKGSSTGVRLYEPRQDQSSPQRLALVGELRQAIEQDQLAVHVQPKGRLVDGTVVGVEALVRWHHPVHGNLPPDEFVGVAERSGLIGALTHVVLRQSLAGVASWRAAGREIGVAVNLSARSLVDLDIVEELATLLRRYDVPARLLTLEITEGSVMTDPARTIAVLSAMRDMGVRLSVDDFGTGYSSLSYLKRLPVHEVKIDKSFVTDLITDSDDDMIVRSIIDLADNLSLEVVAEGVEDDATWQRLEALGCTYAQGWHLGRPMPVDELLGWLAAHDERRAREFAARPVRLVR